MTVKQKPFYNTVAPHYSLFPAMTIYWSTFYKLSKTADNEGKFTKACLKGLKIMVVLLSAGYNFLLMQPLRISNETFT